MKLRPEVNVIKNFFMPNSKGKVRYIVKMFYEIVTPLRKIGSRQTSIAIQ